MAFIVLTLHWVCFLSETQEMRPVTRFIDYYQRQRLAEAVYESARYDRYTLLHF